MDADGYGMPILTWWAYPIEYTLHNFMVHNHLGRVQSIENNFTSG